MKKLLKFLIGLLLLPFCFAFARMFYFLMQLLPGHTSGWTAWALPGGFLIAVLGFFLLPRPFRTYVLAHEMTHAFWGLLMGAKVGKMKVGKDGGHVMLSKSNFIISLAPYFFPFYTALIIAVWYGISMFRDMSSYEALWLAAVGLTWGFHLTFTIYMLTQKQPDVLEHGRLFSYIVIFLANLLFVALWIIVVGAPTFREAGGILFSETVTAYNWVWHGLMTVIAFVRSLFVTSDPA